MNIASFTFKYLLVASIFMSILPQRECYRIANGRVPIEDVYTQAIQKKLRHLNLFTALFRKDISPLLRINKQLLPKIYIYTDFLYRRTVFYYC